jgi:septum formation protein
MQSMLLLASASPRRADLLASAGFTFEIRPADVDETYLAGEPPREYALRVARAKASRAAEAADARIVLAADTVVVLDGRVLGKPRDAADAGAMLRDLSGRQHDVLTAVVLAAGGRVSEAVATTRVWFHPLEEAEIAWYVASGEPMGKAGAYGIQGLAARFIERIDGSWSNVVGLPISTVYRMLRRAGAGTVPGN